MRKTAILAFLLIIILLIHLTFLSAQKAFQSDWQLPEPLNSSQEEHRLVLITQDMETPFWDKVTIGAKKQAVKSNVSLEVWGSYGKNQDDFLKNIEIAIQSKVDGIIIQGLDTEEFKDLTKVKAAFHGIPVITVANDVPMAESIRRTYVGSDQYEAGKMIARQILKDMGKEGNVVLMYDKNQEFYQKQRLDGIQDILKFYNTINLTHATSDDTREQVIATTQDVMNKQPDVEAFIAINANFAGAMIEEIGKRSQVEPYHIYSFDDGPESLSLLMQGKLDGFIEQEPEEMGRKSVQLMKEWLTGVTVPLDKVGYLTDIRFRKAASRQ
ncbi:substrate-binding domain-containing protein [Sutcliffiella horikoshii]|uniref:sugar ABC transporter substrate-binding protein n=1 Tax=Sutcliffiella horikoshii TaxID=79883 RepID=UPI00384D6815